MRENDKKGTCMEKKSFREKAAYVVCYTAKFLVWVFYKKPKVLGTENLPEEPCIIVGNHTKMNGPICAVLYYPRPQAIWCAGEMMDMKEVPDYAYRDFWSEKPEWIRPFFRLVSHLIAWPAEAIFTVAPTIPVYHDGRVMNTYRGSIDALEAGKDVIIFPEGPEENNHILNQFQEGFVDTARMYYRRTGKTLSFVPLYNAPTIHKMVFGEPIAFDPTAPIKAERKRICAVLTERITALAEALPEHKVVPYNNVKKKYYQSSRASAPAEVKKN